MPDTITYLLLGLGFVATFFVLIAILGDRLKHIVLQVWSIKAEVETHPPTRHDDEVVRINNWRAVSLKHKYGQRIGGWGWGVSVSQSLEPDHLVYGQYIELSPGSYVAVFRIRIDSDTLRDNEVAYLDVVCNDNGNDADTIIADLSVKRSEFKYTRTYRDFSVPFEIDEPKHRVEFRVRFANTADLLVHSIELLAK